MILLRRSRGSRGRGHQSAGPLSAFLSELLLQAPTFSGMSSKGYCFLWSFILVFKMESYLFLNPILETEQNHKEYPVLHVPAAWWSHVCVVTGGSAKEQPSTPVTEEGFIITLQETVRIPPDRGVSRGMKSDCQWVMFKAQAWIRLHGDRMRRHTEGVVLKREDATVLHSVFMQVESKNIYFNISQGGKNNKFWRVFLLTSFLGDDNSADGVLHRGCTSSIRGNNSTGVCSVSHRFESRALVSLEQESSARRSVNWALEQRLKNTKKDLVESEPPWVCHMSQSHSPGATVWVGLFFFVQMGKYSTKHCGCVNWENMS